MAVPEAALHLEYRSMPAQQDVRTAGQRSIMQAETKAQRVQGLTHGHFGLCVFRPNQRHHLRALAFGEYVAALRR